MHPFNHALRKEAKNDRPLTTQDTNSMDGDKTEQTESSEESSEDDSENSKEEENEEPN